MERLQMPLNKKGKLQNLTKIQKFYSEFNSESSSSSTSPSEDNDRGVFTFETRRSRHNYDIKPQEPHSNKRQLPSKIINANAVTDNNLLSSPKEDADKVVNYAPPVAPMSPGLSRNQDLKDKALEIIYQKKIKELKCKNYC